MLRSLQFDVTFNNPHKVIILCLPCPFVFSIMLFFCLLVCFLFVCLGLFEMKFRWGSVNQQIWAVPDCLQRAPCDCVCIGLFACLVNFQLVFNEVFLSYLWVCRICFYGLWSLLLLLLFKSCQGTQCRPVELGLRGAGIQGRLDLIWRPKSILGLFHLAGVWNDKLEGLLHDLFQQGICCSNGLLSFFVGLGMKMAAHDMLEFRYPENLANLANSAASYCGPLSERTISGILKNTDLSVQFNI